MFTPKAAHNICFVIGALFLLTSFYLAFFVPNSQFYTSFALGSWLTIDYVDYRLNRTSTLAFFFNHKHRTAFIALFIISFFACFTVDFAWGVRILKAWEWKNYTTIEFIRMYLIMNLSFVLGMYELYRVISTLIKKHISDENLFNIRMPYNKKDVIYVGFLLTGIIFLISPLYMLALDATAVAEYMLLFPFISIALITDSVTYLTKGKPLLDDLMRLNKLKITSILFTVAIAFTITETLNLFGREWSYVRLPFQHIHVFSVPLSAFIGWIPLIVGLICMVNMTKHLYFISKN